MSEKRPFLREPNIWRLIGLGIAAVGVAVILSPYDKVIWLYSVNPDRAITVGGMIFVFGGLSFWPTIREAIGKRISK